MIFLSEVKELKVWNPTKRALLGTFKKGVFNAKTEEEIAILDAVPEAYRADESEPEGEPYVAPEEPGIVVPDIDLEDMSPLQLKGYAKLHGITLKGSIKAKNTMLKAIRDAEAEVAQDEDTEE